MTGRVLLDVPYSERWQALQRIGAGIAAKDSTGSQFNDQMRMKDGGVTFTSNNAGGITGGLATGQPIVARLTVKPTPTIARPP